SRDGRTRRRAARSRADAGDVVATVAGVDHGRRVLEIRGGTASVAVGEEHVVLDGEAGRAAPTAEPVRYARGVSAIPHDKVVDDVHNRAAARVPADSTEDVADDRVVDDVDRRD